MSKVHYIDFKGHIYQRWCLIFRAYSRGLHIEYGIQNLNKSQTKSSWLNFTLDVNKQKNLEIEMENIKPQQFNGAKDNFV